MQTKQMGEVWIASDGDCSSIGTTEDQAIRGVKDAKVPTEKEKFFKNIEDRIKEGLLDIRPFNMKLPVMYNDIPPNERWKVREEYIKVQDGLCSHCNEPLSGEASSEVLSKDINLNLFPNNFLKHPIHLHHSHDTGLTIGAIHCYCNAVLWQYHGE